MTAQSLMVDAIVAVVRVYKLCVSPLLGDCCRFYPSCADYFVEALRTHGILKGGWLGLRRLSRCHALNPGGIDPVPPCGEV